jgi:hypothetical protein
LRDLLIELAAARLFRAKWTRQIREEWITSVLRDRPDIARSDLERTRDLMNESVLNCLIENYEALIPSIDCPDQDDRHVIAAAIKGRCAALITVNLRDFPSSELDKYDIELLHPDEFIHHQLGLNQAAVIRAARNCRARLRKPPKTAQDYLDALRRQGLPKTVRAFEEYADLI